MLWNLKRPGSKILLPPYFKFGFEQVICKTKMIILRLWKVKNDIFRGCECSSVTEYLPILCKALGSIPNTAKRKKQKHLFKVPKSKLAQKRN
jgi:hypothetical protein